MESLNGTLKNSSSSQAFQGLHQKLMELKEEKKAIIEKSGDAILVVHSLTGEIFEANSRAAALTGYEVSGLQGMKVGDLIPQQGILSEATELHSLNGNGGSTAKLKRQDGIPILVEVSICSIHRGEEPLKLVFIRKPGQTNGRSINSVTDGLEPIPEPIYEFPNIIGKSEKIRKICQLIGQVTKTDSTVLVQGESGTGKEIVAQVIHFHSSRSKGPFVKVNCAALSETLLESELFGHVKGAFTGAIRDRKGRFKQADGGTIFLDEIGCMSLSGQAKLLRVLEEREFEPVGSSATTSVNVRVVAASKINLMKAVSDGEFREDLYYRLNVFSLFMPPLREKKEDIPLLIQHFLRKYNLAVGKQIRGLTPQALDLMMQYDWPGNVRELKNAVEHAVIVAKESVIVPSNLPLNFPVSANEGVSLPEEFGLRDKLNFFEKQIIQDALKRAKGIKKQAAALLQIDPRNLPYLLKKHNINDSI